MILPIVSEHLDDVLGHEFALRPPETNDKAV